jgi:hypothetical protein
LFSAYASAEVVNEIAVKRGEGLINNKSECIKYANSKSPVFSDIAQNIIANGQPPACEGF